MRRRFARGGSLESDMAFATIADRRAVSYLHIDRPPNVYWQSATWSADHVVLVADTVKAPPFAPDQFTYSITGARLQMRWEVSRNGVRGGR